LTQKKKRLIKDPWWGSCGVYLEAIEIVEASVFELRFSWSYKKFNQSHPFSPGFLFNDCGGQDGR
jgi:hypothetical protein